MLALTRLAVVLNGVKALRQLTIRVLKPSQAIEPTQAIRAYRHRPSECIVTGHQSVPSQAIRVFEPTQAIRVFEPTQASKSTARP